jgi:3-phenylpropionate/cinnamic acid dioxygenase small subunit
VKPILLLPLLIFQLTAQPPAESTPKDVENFLRETAEDLSNKDVRAFLNHFDPKMAGYEMLHYEVEGLVSRDAVVSTIEIVTDKGDRDNRRHRIELDWILIVDSERSQRKIVTVTIEKQGKQWKITALDPVEFFKPTAAP